MEGPQHRSDRELHRAEIGHDWGTRGWLETVSGQLTCAFDLERVTGIEPAWPAWKGPWTDVDHEDLVLSTRCWGLFLHTSWSRRGIAADAAVPSPEEAGPCRRMSVSGWRSRPGSVGVGGSGRSSGCRLGGSGRGCWGLDWRYVSAPVTFATRTEASWVDLQHADQVRGVWKAPARRGASPTVGEYVARWITEHPSAKSSTEEMYFGLLRTCIAPTLGRVPLPELTSERVPALALRPRRTPRQRRPSASRVDAGAGQGREPGVGVRWSVASGAGLPGAVGGDGDGGPR